MQGSFRRTNVNLIGGMAFLVFSVIFPINNHPPALFRHVIVKHKELAVRSLFFRFYRRKHPENIDFRGVFGSPCWARTNDIVINSHALYRLS